MALQKFKQSFLRKGLVKLHLWTGLLIGIVLIIVSLTGSLLVFYFELDALANADLLTINIPANPAKVPLQQVKETVQQTYPNYKLDRLDMPKHPNQAYKIRMVVAKDSWIWIYVNPYTGEITGTRESVKSWLWWLLHLHIYLQLGETGLVINGIMAMLIVVMSITGLVIWWPGAKEIKSGFMVKWNTSWKRVNWELHKVTGILSLIFLILIGITGVYFAFPEPFEKFVYWSTNSTKETIKPKSTPQQTSKALTLDETLKAADMAIAKDKTSVVYFARNAEATIAIYKTPLDKYGWSIVYADQYSGQLLKAEDVRNNSLGKRVMNLMGPIHFGTWGGIWSQILWVIFGLTPPFLFITGFLMWWNRVVRKKLGGFNQPTISKSETQENLTPR